MASQNARAFSDEEKEKVQKLALLSDLEKRQKRIQQQKEKLAREERLLKSAIKKKARKNEDRRKILVGAMFLKKAENNSGFKKDLYAELTGFLREQRDIVLFPELNKN